MGTFRCIAFRGTLHRLDSQQGRSLRADYSLAVAEAGAFHADLVLELDSGLQKALSQRDPQAWTLWKQVRSYAGFYSHPAQEVLQAAADVAGVVDDLDPSDEALNLMARHNIPFKVSLATNLQSEDLEGVDVVVVFAKAEKELSDSTRAACKPGQECRGGGRTRFVSMAASGSCTVERTCSLVCGGERKSA